MYIVPLTKTIVQWLEQQLNLIQNCSSCTLLVWEEALCVFVCCCPGTMTRVPCYSFSCFISCVCVCLLCILCLWRLTCIVDYSLDSGVCEFWTVLWFLAWFSTRKMHPVTRDHLWTLVHSPIYFPPPLSLSTLPKCHLPTKHHPSPHSLHPFTVSLHSVSSSSNLPPPPLVFLSVYLFILKVCGGVLEVGV